MKTDRSFKYKYNYIYKQTHFLCGNFPYVQMVTAECKFDFIIITKIPLFSKSIYINFDQYNIIIS